jgi:ribosomal protein S10
MPFVTRLTLKSGDGDRLEAVVGDIKERAERKGVELKGPHPEPPTRHSVPQYRGLPSDGTFAPWSYTVYTRVIEIVDHNEFAREVAERAYPDSIHISADIEQFSQAGDG